MLVASECSFNALVKSVPKTSWTFFSYAYLALYNDMVAHAIKVLDKHKDASSILYLYRCNKKEFEFLSDKYELPYEDIEVLSDKLNQIRDKTHFHIDKSAVFNPSAIWKGAKIKNSFFNSVMEKLWEVLKELHLSAYNKPFIQYVYDGADVEVIIKAVKKAKIKI
ncbi:MAG: hypothetical protein HY787_21515 [Deltaproteobacteria bacterium]|nr:hypothetical protein [Deltaproteobacteria bacterium]